MLYPSLSVSRTSLQQRYQPVNVFPVRLQATPTRLLRDQFIQFGLLRQPLIHTLGATDVTQTVVPEALRASVQYLSANKGNKLPKVSVVADLDHPGWFNLLNGTEPIGRLTHPETLLTKPVTIFEHKLGDIYLLASSTLNADRRYILMPGGSLKLGKATIELFDTKHHGLLAQKDFGPIIETLSPPLEPKPNGITSNAFILAAGLGSRIQPMSLDTFAKPSLPLDSRNSIAGALVKHLAYHGFDQVTYSTGVAPDSVKQAVGQAVQDMLSDRQTLINTDHHHDADMPGTAGVLVKILDGYFDEKGRSLPSAAQQSSSLITPDKPLLMVMGDAFTNFDATKFIQNHAASKAWFTLGAKQMTTEDELSQLGTMVLKTPGTSSEIMKFVEKPPKGSQAMAEAIAGGKVANTAFYAFHPAVYPVMVLYHRFAKTHGLLGAPDLPGGSPVFDFGKHFLPFLMALSHQRQFSHAIDGKQDIIFELSDNNKELLYYANGKTYTPEGQVVHVPLGDAQPKLHCEIISGNWFDVGDPYSYVIDGINRAANGGMGDWFSKFVLGGKARPLTDPNTGVTSLTPEARQLSNKRMWNNWWAMFPILNWFFKRESPDGNVFVV